MIQLIKAYVKIAKKNLELKKKKEAEKEKLEIQQPEGGKEQNKVTLSKAQMLEQAGIQSTVPFFDINFKFVLKELSEQKDQEEALSLEAIDGKLEAIKDLFGIKNLENSIIHLKNQSLVPLGWLPSPRVSVPRGGKIKERRSRKNWSRGDRPY